MLGISWVLVRMRDQHITNERCAEMLGVPDWRVIVGRRSTRWLGHVARMAPTRLARQTLFGFVKGRTQKRTGRRRNLVSHARSVLTGLPKLDMRIWAHTTQDKAEWNDLCSQWNRDTPEFIVDDPRKCPICSKCYRNLGTRITRTHAVSTEMFKCPIDGCGEVFKTKNARTIHLKNEHY